MAKAQQRFAVDEEDSVITSWIEAQKNISMSVHVLIHDYVKRFGSTDAYAAVLSRGFGPATQVEEVHIPAQKEKKPAPVRAVPSQKKTNSAQTVLEEDDTKQETAETSADGANPSPFGFDR